MALRAAILAAADAVDAARNELGELDGVAGDGDHGMTMSIGARNVRRKLDALGDDATPTEVIRATGSAMSGVGGAIGPLYSGALAAVAADLPPGDGPVSVGTLRSAAAAAEAAIVRLGQASPGDKTVLDALHPLVESLRRSEVETVSLDEALGAAAEAADEGAASTAGMVARIGRASRLGERSRGQADAGARSFAIVVRALVAGRARDDHRP